MSTRDVSSKQENLDVRISLSCDDVFIILGLLKEENK